MRLSIFSSAFLAGVVIAFLWPRYFFLDFAGIGISGFDLATFALVILAVVKLAVDGTGRRLSILAFRSALLIAVAIAIFLAWQILSTFNNAASGASLKLGVLPWIYSFIWLFIAVVFLVDERSSRLLPIITVACGFGAFLFALIEWALQSPLLDALGLIQFAAGDRKNLEAIAFASTDGFSLRIKSVFVHPIIFGQVMALLSPFALHLIINNLGVRRLIGIAFMLVILASIILCQSRSPIGVLLAALGTYLVVFLLDVRSPGRLTLLFGVSLLSLVVLPLVVEVVLDAVLGQSIRDLRSNNVREVQMAKAQNAVPQKPIFGYGPSTGPRIAGVDGRNDVRTLDSFYIKTIVELGIPGLFMYFVLQLLMIIYALRRALMATSVTERGILAATVAMLVGSNIGLTIIASTDAYFFALLFFGYSVAHDPLMREKRLQMERKAIYLIRTQAQPSSTA